MSFINLEVDTHDRRLGFDLMGTSSLSLDQQVLIPGGATLTFRGTQIRKEFGAPETLQLVISLTGGVATGVLANWLYDKLKGRATTSRINRREVHIENGQITKIIEEQIQQDSK